MYLSCTASNDAAAKGFASPGGFTVLAGSAVSEALVPSFEGTACRKLRRQLEETGVIKGGAFSQDYEFSAPSAAASVVLGRSSNGNVY